MNFIDRVNFARGFHNFWKKFLKSLPGFGVNIVQHECHEDCLHIVEQGVLGGSGEQVDEEGQHSAPEVAPLANYCLFSPEAWS